MSTAAGTEQEADADGHQHHHDDARLGERDVSRNLVSGRGQRGLGRGGGKNRLCVRNRRFQATTSRLPETDALPAAVVSGRSLASPWTPAAHPQMAAGTKGEYHARGKQERRVGLMPGPQDRLVEPSRAGQAAQRQHVNEGGDAQHDLGHGQTGQQT